LDRVLHCGRLVAEPCPDQAAALDAILRRESAEPSVAASHPAQVAVRFEPFSPIFELVSGRHAGTFLDTETRAPRLSGDWAQESADLSGSGPES
jgi:hypothetical protein